MSSIQCLQDKFQDAVLPVLVIVVDEPINGNTGDLVLACSNTTPLVVIDDLGYRLLFLRGKAVRSRLFAKLFDNPADGFDGGVVIP